MTERPAEPIVMHGLTFDLAAMSEQGPRSENQDAFSIERFASTGIVALADGMGGERSGRLAADTALQAIVGAGPIRSLDEARRAVRTADATVVRQAGSDPDAHGGMGCALGVLALTRVPGDGTGWVGAHVGDVRILSRAPDGTLRLETRDHTPAFAKWEAGEITLDEIPDSAGANRLQRAVGRGGEADAVWIPARPGWSWLLVSDGVYKAVRMDELARMMDTSTAAEAVEAIRKKVEERGPEDNYTAVLVRAVDGNTTGRSVNAPLFAERTRAMEPPNSAPRHKGRSGWAVVANLLAIIALAAAGLALWTAWDVRESGVSRAEINRLHSEVDSLRAQLEQMSQPLFGPTGAPPPATSPAPQTGAPP